MFYIFKIDQMIWPFSDGQNGQFNFDPNNMTDMQNMQRNYPGMYLV